MSLSRGGRSGGAVAVGPTAEALDGKAEVRDRRLRVPLCRPERAPDQRSRWLPLAEAKQGRGPAFGDEEGRCVERPEPRFAAIARLVPEDLVGDVSQGESLCVP